MLADRVAQILAETRDRAERARVEAATLLEAELRREVGEQGNRRAPSRPGDAPKRQTGRGQRSIRAEVVGDAVVVTAGPHMVALDRGTGRVAARPWVQPVLHRLMPRLRALFLP